MRRALILAVSMLGLFSVIFFLPDVVQTQCMLSLELPERLGTTILKSYPASEKEVKTLDRQAEFAKAACGIPREEEMDNFFSEPTFDRADLSVVLSGYDLANSIHRPERCMPAQGHVITGSEPSSVKLKDGTIIPLTLLTSKKTEDFGTADAPKPKTFDSLTCYFFIGHRQITADHTKRTLIDIYDRLVHGEAQRWAYVSVSMLYRADDSDPTNKLPTRDMARRKIHELISKFTENNLHLEASRKG
jgi:Protein of unknown function (DUF3485)